MINLAVAGHGGSVEGEFGEYYLTRGKKFKGFFEGEVDRLICEMLKEHCTLLGLTSEFINPGPINIPLAQRVAFINKLNRKEKCRGISNHCNAAQTKVFSKANGFTVFHSKRASKTSIRLAELVEKNMKAADLGIRSRGIEQANHWITTQTNCPFILVECGFMTNRSDAAQLQKFEVLSRIGEAQALAFWQLG